jgi:hypothetical protein
MSRQTASFDELCQAFSQCDPDELRAALDYYTDHKQLIDEDIERNRQAWNYVVANYGGPRDSDLSG